MDKIHLHSGLKTSQIPSQSTTSFCILTIVITITPTFIQGKTPAFTLVLQGQSTKYQLLPARNVPMTATLAIETISAFLAMLQATTGPSMAQVVCLCQDISKVSQQLAGNVGSAVQDVIQLPTIIVQPVFRDIS